MQLNSRLFIKFGVIKIKKMSLTSNLIDSFADGKIKNSQALEANSEFLTKIKKKERKNSLDDLVASYLEKFNHQVNNEPNENDTDILDLQNQIKFIESLDIEDFQHLVYNVSRCEASFNKIKTTNCLKYAFVCKIHIGIFK